MRGLVILLITFTLIKNLIAKDLSEGISGSDIPQMRTGFSLQPSNTENFNAACRRLVIARFSENIRNANPDDAEKILNTIQTIIPASDFAAVSGESAVSLLTQIQHAAIQEIKPKLSASLRHDIPEELILSSGFVAHEQSPLDMAGCYIRLGMNLRDFGLSSLAATSFLKSGTLFADVALHSPLEVRVDFLLSTAQCYYWSYCNESHSTRKETLKNLATLYFEKANTTALSLSESQKTFWIPKIEEANAKLLAKIN